MSRRRFSSVLSAFLLVLGSIVAGPAHAVFINGPAMFETSVIEDGPISTMVWNFAGLTAGTGLATLTLNYTRLDTNLAGEFLNVEVDGMLIGDTSSSSGTACVNGTDATFGEFGSDCTVTGLIFMFDTAKINDDLGLTVTVSNGAGVNSLIDITNGPGFVDFTIEYEGVPEPAPMALIGLGLIGAGFAGRRTKG